MVYFDKMLLSYNLSILTWLDIGMPNGDDALPSNILAGRGILVKMLNNV